MDATNPEHYEPFIVEVTEGDEPFEDSPITEIQPGGGGWHCTQESDWTIFVPNMPIEQYGEVLRAGIEPKIGDRLRLYGSFGHEVQGIQVNDDVVFYRTQTQREARRRRWLEDNDARKERAFTLKQGALDAEFEALPPFFRQRIERFRAEDPDFRKESEGYEMFCCTEAVKIALALESSTLGVEAAEGQRTALIQEQVMAFYDLPWEQQKQRVPGLGDGHSGNTFGGACNLAAAYLRHLAGEAVSV